MKQKSIFISGASRGIGLAIAKRFYKEGFRVIICSSNKSNLEKAKKALPALETFVCDISSKKQVVSLSKKILDKFGPLDVLVNNGGIYLPGQVHKEKDSVYEKMINTNLSSAYYFTKNLLPAMMKKKSGTIFNMCSVASIVPYVNGGSYCISKFALLGFSKVLREEMKPYNIRVISVLPGSTFTSSWDGVDLPEERFIPAEDVAELIFTSWNLSERTVVEEIIVRPFKGDL